MISRSHPFGKYYNIDQELTVSIQKGLGSIRSSHPECNRDVTSAATPVRLEHFGLLVTMIVKYAQSSLTTVKSWKTAYIFLIDALKQTQSELPHWLWKYEYPTDIDKYKK
ncbi:hypothetical protein BDF21DRAFT_393650 [Thamnidium elegans]|nr:hypothetical protein BDF21DRAFT_393650 [Thamnidium elegans]